jgi:hypothetical protein
MKAELDPIVRFLRGSAGNFLYRKMNGKTVVCPRPDRSNIVPTENQVAHRERFKKASRYGRQVMADAEARSLYGALAKERDLPITALSIADFLNAPVIHEVGVFGYSGEVGDTIIVSASDDVGVEKVHVSISAPDGSPIENGEAVESGAGSGLWVYTATVQGQPVVKIQAVAQDRPGGTAVMNIDKTF